MYRARFRALEDYRPVNWPIKHPYWCTGYGENYSTVVAYADDEAYILANWPEADEIELGDEVDEYVFTDRFAKPDWFESDGD
jgi:hypothetical protein